MFTQPVTMLRQATNIAFRHCDARYMIPTTADEDLNEKC